MNLSVHFSNISNDDLEYQKCRKSLDTGESGVELQVTESLRNKAGKLKSRSSKLRKIATITDTMAVTDMSDDSSQGSISQGSLSALDRALIRNMNNSKDSFDADLIDGSESSCSASSDTVSTNLDASNQCQAQTAPSAKKKKNRRVQFSDKARVRKIPHHSSLTEEQISQMWFSKADYKELRKDCAQRIKFLDKVKLKHPNEAPFCTRGLLSHTAEARAKKNAYRDVMYDALAQALEKEIEEGLEEALGEICRICSAPSVKAAHIQGLRDERDAKKIHALKSAEMKSVQI